MTPFRLSLRLAVLALVIAALPRVAAAQTAADALRFSERSGAVGPRMIGLGGAGTAGFADPGALFANPAGLGFYARSEFSGALGFTSVADDAQYVVGSDGSMFDADIQNTRLDHLAFISKVPTAQGSLVFGAAYQQTNVFDRNLSFRHETTESSISASFLPRASEYEINDSDNAVFFGDPSFIAYNAGLIEYLPENLDTGEYPFYEAVKAGTNIEQKGQVLEEGIMQELAFGGAWEASKDVMVGLATNISFGRYNFTSRFEEFDIDQQNGPDDYVILLDGGERRGFESLRVTDYFRSDLLGVNFRGGLSARVSNAPLRVGVTVESPTWYAINEDYGTEMETTFDEGAPLVYGGVEDEAGFGEFEYTLSTPWRFGVGLAFDSGPLLVSADVEAVNWQEMRFDADGFYDAIDETNTVIRDTYRRVFNTRLGAEYRFGAVTVRGGLGYRPDARKGDDVFADDVQGADGARTMASAGLSYSLNRNASLDIGYMHTEFDDAYVPYGDVGFYQQPTPQIEESVMRDRLSFGIRIGL